MGAAQSNLITITSQQRRFASWMTDVLIYTVVLNLFVEYNDAIIIDSFTISILTAILLKLLLDVILSFEHRVRGFFSTREGASWKAAGAASMIAILFIGKLVILEVVNFVFGEHVELGHLIDVIVLVIALMATRRVALEIYNRLGEGVGDKADDLA